ncbi:hypothetical protein L6452_44097 [Arctium lappa]|uniref:Uncharacterized protein n=1 Tax=Arctium lappa TaxID=4217 RepID=A0ACB8XIQ9_ARCLA|nr:hypothetical protein L6452_44097 [Arctium lappa]
MSLSNKNAENTPDQVVTNPIATKFCERKRSEEGGFIGNAKEYMKSFIHAPLNEHKACFKATWHKMIGRLQEGKCEAWKGGNRNDVLENYKTLIFLFKCN